MLARRETPAFRELASHQRFDFVEDIERSSENRDFVHAELGWNQTGKLEWNSLSSRAKMLKVANKRRLFYWLVAGRYRFFSYWHSSRQKRCVFLLLRRFKEQVS
ncbi:hypothetical protein NDU88_002733 [Pleurodeles waltl]|uniref:Uncharacterized protein n=1 Tax=Pleurodeles waltl TaxID=8319 RepID=A0AAV7MRE3_PLEWA|nr:hypothetical protein NDU88_002733 [Pleurodeles waltl]